MSHKFEIEGQVDVIRVAEHLEAIAAALRNGIITIEHDGAYIVLNPTGTTELEIEAEYDDDRTKLEIEIQWVADSDASPLSDVLISSSIPDYESKAIEPEEKEEEEDVDPNEESDSEEIDDTSDLISEQKNVVEDND